MSLAYERVADVRDRSILSKKFIRCPRPDHDFGGSGVVPGAQLTLDFRRTVLQQYREAKPIFAISVVRSRAALSFFTNRLLSGLLLISMNQ